MNTQLAIVLVNYNSADDTLACLDSIECNISEKYHVVIVDNFSDDFNILNSRLKNRNNICLIRNHKNFGFGRANNIGIDWAFGNINFEYLLLLNNDTLIEKNAISNLITPFSMDTKIGVTTSRIMYQHNRNLVWYGGGDIIEKRGWPKITDYNKKPSIEGAKKSKFVSFVSGCVMMFKKDCLQDIGGFDEDFFMYCEDLELCMRLKKKGYKLWYESSSIIYHKVQGSSKNKNIKATGITPQNTNSDFLFYHIKSNQWIANHKNKNLNSFLVFNIYFLADILYTLLTFIKAGQLGFLKTYMKMIGRIVTYQIKN